MRDRPRLLDLFCCAGGAARGYSDAGFLIVGIDNRPQPHYPFPFIQMDALEAMDRLIAGEGLLANDGRTYYLADFDVIHASPPCQGYSVTRSMHDRPRPLLIEPLRERLHGRDYVIENVPGAPLHDPIILCGSMFNLAIPERGYLRRHRLFESNLSLSIPGACMHGARALTVVNAGRKSSSHWNCTTAEEARMIMEMPWATRSEIAEAIPPAYTQWIGTQLLDVLGWEQV